MVFTGRPYETVRRWNLRPDRPGRAQFGAPTVPPECGDRVALLAGGAQLVVDGTARAPDAVHADYDAPDRRAPRPLASKTGTDPKPRCRRCSED